MRDTRAHTVYAHVLAALRHSGIDQGDFADAVAALYAQRTPPHARRVEFHAHARGVDPYGVRRANEQLLFRMLRPDGPARMPAELEEAVVLALPQPYRDECLRELSERYGLLAAALPTADDAPVAEQVRSPCELMRKAAAAVERIAPMLEDGHIGPEDAPHFAQALASINAMMGCGVTLIAQITDAMHAEREQRPEAAQVHEFPRRAGREV